MKNNSFFRNIKEAWKTRSNDGHKLLIDAAKDEINHIKVKEYTASIILIQIISDLFGNGWSITTAAGLVLSFSFINSTILSSKEIYNEYKNDVIEQYRMVIDYLRMSFFWLLFFAPPYIFSPAMHDKFNFNHFSESIGTLIAKLFISTFFGMGMSFVYLALSFMFFNWLIKKHDN
ncbi:hypothetical protein [Convivina intestini]|uniref:hypothetical protein n=1 Tax=Convivina intestini TaxID=1505726 RepID=UPI00200C66B8|nr:hypothetical protein [Convivina intestini]CAH1852509.1 hypothetical protein R078131_00492 [Convivina intestini]